jgi:LysM repeat protein
MLAAFIKHLMNTLNPFQIPSCFHRADLQQRRRERFRRGVVAVVVAMVALLVILLIEGCVGEHAKTSAVAAGQPEAVLASTMTVESQPASTIPARPVASPTIVPSVAVKVATPPEFVYTVKPSDTLIRIARLHHTTAKIIKDMNSLDSDMITVGAKLKLPSV